MIYASLEAVIHIQRQISALTYAAMLPQDRNPDGETIKSETRAACAIFVKRISSFAAELEMNDLLYLTQSKFLPRLEDAEPLTCDELQAMSQRMQDSLDGTMAAYGCIILSKKEVTHFNYDGPPLFGNQVDTQFPSSSFEIAEAGKSFAIGRYTACVFHLMRALEKPLCAFAKVFNIPFAHSNWGPIIDQLESKINDMGKDPNKAPTWKDDQVYYSQAASHFIIFKNAWRNHTAHGHGKYTEEEAEMILRGVKVFMQKLAERLSE